ncbi:MAG: S8 family serine peptidase, partial [Promethearchaeota archaeon]
YDIVPAVALECDPEELLNKEHLFRNELSIKSVYKSRTFTQPYIDEIKPQTSALSLIDYSNWWLPAIGADNLEYNGSGVRVAVIDTGVFDHPDLNYDPSNDARNFVSDGGFTNLSDYNDGHGHGTHCAGIIGSNGGGSQGEYRGVAPGVTIINARAGSILGGLNDSDILNAIDWCVNPALGDADIISMSFGGGYPVAVDALARAINNATRQGVICVAAAGNNGPTYFTGGMPGAAKSVITVGATNSNNDLASFSSRGPTFTLPCYPDISAPGVDIISTMAPESVIAKDKEYRGDIFNFAGSADYYPLSGTSMACPMVAGAVAILKEAYPSLNPETARIALMEGATKISDEIDARVVNSGAGLINITASLAFLDDIYLTYGDVNNVIKVFPDNLPIEPFDLLNFPGDHQKINLTIISGVSDIFTIDIPSSDNGVVFSIESSTVNFAQRGVNFTALTILIEDHALPGPRNYFVNVSNGAGINATINVSFTVSLPEHRILMESYHGLNDMYFVDTDNFSAYATNTFYQMGFYDAMSYMTARNISIDYLAEFWTPYYNKNTNNSFLTKEKLAQYDLVVFQNPILAYNPMETEAINEYYRNGGNILLLGTYYEKLCVDNVNLLLLLLDSGIQFNKENLIDLTYAGLFSEIDSYELSNLSLTHPICQDVSRIYWEGGTTLSVSGPTAEVLAIHEGQDLIAACDGNLGTGKIVVFGDASWMHYDFTRSGYDTNHSMLLSNIMDYFFPENEISLNIRLNSERINDGQFELTLYVKNQSSELPITYSDYSSMLVTIGNETYSDTIQMNITKASNGIYFNESVEIPDPSNMAYNITVNIEIDGETYNSTSKILYYDEAELPAITSLDINDDIIYRGSQVELSTSLSVPSTVKGFTSLYYGNTLSTRSLINRSYEFVDDGDGNYSYDFNILSSDPSGFGITYICAQSLENYTNPYSPRMAFYIQNNAPSVSLSQSEIGGIPFNQLIVNKTIYVITATQNAQILLEVESDDNEDSDANIKVALTLLICSLHDTSNGTYFVPMFPISFINEELEYNSISGRHELTYTIPTRLTYSTISGTKSISTDTHALSGGDYIGALFISVTDRDGGHDFIVLVIEISPLKESLDPILIIGIVLGIIAGVGIITVVVINKRKPKKRKGTHPYSQYFRPSPGDESTQQGEYYSEKVSVDGPQFTPAGRFCTHCGKPIIGSDKFCRSCGHPT